MSDQHNFLLLVRIKRQASELHGRLVGAGFYRSGGHTYRLVPAKAFDAVLATLARLGGVTPEPSSPLPTKETP